jgi:hypothetical protein
MVTHGDAITCSTVGKTHIVVEAVGRTSLISLYLLYIYHILSCLYPSWPCSSAKDVELRDDRSRADCTVAWTTW